ncbi:hypothetical protein C8035_v006877 [Colletotrichum spinosum]|uniref:Uncharacterized protein n=1 Tax=Colletotrichum spinosum TaxID=1347390 RepID=A0A4R8QIW6_9PEZI|nr:hypothetical protein C8035_v006877 [Colletotrichum spinosum]
MEETQPLQPEFFEEYPLVLHSFFIRLSDVYRAFSLKYGPWVHHTQRARVERNAAQHAANTPVATTYQNAEPLNSWHINEYRMTSETIQGNILRATALEPGSRARSFEVQLAFGRLSEAQSLMQYHIQSCQYLLASFEPRSQEPQW